MLTAFYVCLGLFVFIYLLKLALTIIYIKKLDIKTEQIDGSRFSIVQPLMSGDEMLEERLILNLESSGDMNFIFILDKGDVEAENMVERIMAKNENFKDRIKIVSVDDIPLNVHRKVYKLKFAVEFAREFFVVLDDDTIINPMSIGKVMKFLEEDKTIVTGIPFYTYGNGFLSDLLSAFVNTNTLFAYLGLSLLRPMRKVNGMFYIVKTDALKELNAYEKIQNQIPEELAFGMFFANNGYKIIQSTVPCGMSTTFETVADYCNHMKRWMVFANRYMMKDLSSVTFLMGIAPVFLPLILLVLSIILGLKYLLLYLAVHFMKAVFNFYFRKKVLDSNEKFYCVFLEIFADFLQVIHYLHAIVSPKKLVWRNHEVHLDGESFTTRTIASST